MEEVALNESLHDLTEAEKETEQHLRRLSKRIRSRTTPRKALTDLTNSSECIQSPKTHTELSKRFHEVIKHAPSANSFDTFSRHESFYEGKICRKRCSRSEQPSAKRRYEDVCPTVDENEEEYVGEPMSISLMRVQSTSYIESGRCARDQLPGLLHVDYSLRTLSKPQIDSVAFKSIDGATLAALMDSMELSEFERKFVIVDCRYPYEYNGGHIRSAINLHDPSNLRQVFYPSSPTRSNQMLGKIPIFYCEYSQKRGPAMAAALRQYDRCRNEARYPDVDYKEIYVLDRGYRKFFKQDGLTRLCEPPAYVPMMEPSYRDELKQFQLHRTKSFCGLSSCFRLGGSVESGPRRIRLAFRSISEKTSSSTRCTHQQTAKSFPSPRSIGCDAELFGSPFSHPPESGTPPQNINAPIRLPKFS
uniref:protein-tyrosine-phosphatase n=1 Tax=Ascaris suum TaxID=6253 RepID=F1KQF4_ASCSU